MKKAQTRLWKLELSVLAVVAAVLLVGCEPAAPTNLAKTDDYPCTLTWQDNSNNESGFNILIGGSCTDCSATTNWTKLDSVGADTTTYTSNESCCSISECSCAAVNAFNMWGTSDGSNFILLAPVC